MHIEISCTICEMVRDTSMHAHRPSDRTRRHCRSASNIGCQDAGEGETCGNMLFTHVLISQLEMHSAREAWSPCLC